MSVYKASLASIALNSSWSCTKKVDNAHPDGYWAITSGPTEATRSLTFPISIPAGAVIARAWIKAEVTDSPLGGIRYFRINGKDVPSNGELDINITSLDTSFDAAFSFASWGVVFSDTNAHYGTLTVNVPTLYIDYVDVSSGETKPEETVITATAAKEMRLPRLLGPDMHEKARLHCVSLSVTENIDPLSTADMTLPSNAPDVDVDDFVEIFTPYGSAGVYRVYQTNESVLKNRKCAMRHGIVTLADDIVTEGNAIVAPVAQVFASLFAMQSSPLWVMGECDVPGDLEIVLERNHQSALHAFTDLTAKLPDGYAWQFDQISLPWRAHLRAMPEEEVCEFRMARDITGMTIHVDRDSQCTRVYAFGAGEGDERIGLTNLIGTPYLDAAGTDKIIAKTITNEAVFDALTLRSVAEKYLERHKDPTVSIEVDAANIYRQTGLTIDKFHLGKVCRVPLPSLGRTIREKVISIRWKDLIKTPDAVTATLANRLRKVSDEMADLMREATNSKLIGGTLQSVTTEYRNDSVTQTDALVHYFDITGYGNTLAVLVEYSPAGQCALNVDSQVYIPDEETESGKLDILRYLKSDGNGVPIVGRHYVTYFAKGLDYTNVYSKVTVKSIEKKGGGTSYVPVTTSQFSTSAGEAVVTADGYNYKVLGGT